MEYPNLTSASNTTALDILHMTKLQKQYKQFFHANELLLNN
ncbi:hypothetical protein ACR78X_15005 [Sphingobacterium multivorum]|nr:MULTISPECIES: hypothetical protein [Sphingobacterium]